MSGPGKGDKRGYSWPPFTEGHTRSTLSGYRSERQIAPLAAQIEAEELAKPGCPPYLHEASFRHTLSAWAWAEAIVRLIRAWLAEQDVTAWLSEHEEHEETEERTKDSTTRRGTLRRIQSQLDALHKAETRADTLRRRLGLDPAAAAKISRDLSQSRWYAGAVSPLDQALDRIAAERQAAIEAGSDG